MELKFKNLQEDDTRQVQETGTGHTHAATCRLQPNHVLMGTTWWPGKVPPQAPSWGQPLPDPEWEDVSRDPYEGTCVAPGVIKTCVHCGAENCQGHSRRDVRSHG